MTRTRTLFLGTPDFAVPSLEALAQLPEVEIVSVVTQPDRPAGRGRTPHPSAVKVRAQEMGLSVWSPESLRGEGPLAQLRALEPELLVVAAYGEILRPAVLALPRYGALNVHGSLLPRHRGASPVAGALLAGDAASGVTIMKMDAGMDTGPLLTRRALPIRPDHTRGTLMAELALLGASLLAETLPLWLAGRIEAEPQDSSLATTTRLIRKADGKLEWAAPAAQLARQVRAFDPWPGTFTTWEGKRLKVLAAETLPAEVDFPPAPPGTVAWAGDAIAVATGEGWLRLLRVQLAGRGAQEAEQFVNGYSDFVGSRLGET